MARKNGGIIGPANIPTGNFGSAPGVWSLTEAKKYINEGIWPVATSGFQVQNSLRFDDGSSDYLNRTPASTSNTTTWTFSCWVKRANISTTQVLLGARPSAADPSVTIRFSSDNTLLFQKTGGGTTNLITSQLFRDVSAWYHIVMAVDTTQATSSDRVKVYVNGTQVTSFSTSGYPSLNENLAVNNSSYPHFISLNNGYGNYFDGYMSEVVLIDGQQLDETSFGETDATTGNWVPKDVSGLTFGTNGFYLPFQNSAALGQDDSGNGNNFTVNNLTSIDQCIDSPTNNFATGNPIEPPYATGSFSNGNLTYQTSNSTWDSLISTISPTQGKWYFEAKPTTLSANTDFIIGMADRENDPDWFNNQESFKYYGLRGVCYYGNGSYFLNNNTPVSGLTAVSVNDIVGCAIDLDNNFAYFSINGTFLNSGDPTSGASGTGGQDISTAMQSGAFKGFGVSSRNSSVIQCNFGNGYFGTTQVSSAQNPDDGIGIFEYDVPTGYRALCTKSINAEEYS